MPNTVQGFGFPTRLGNTNHDGFNSLLELNDKLVSIFMRSDRVTGEKDFETLKEKKLDLFLMRSNLFLESR